MNGDGRRVRGTRRYKPKCILSYDSMNNIITKNQYPFSELKQCINIYICPKGYFLCKYSRYCIKIDNVWDDIRHCGKGEDELDCGKMIFFPSSLNKHP